MPKLDAQDRLGTAPTWPGALPRARKGWWIPGFAVLFAIAWLLGTGPAAATLFSDGGVHTLDASGPFDEVILSHATTANAVAGANVMPAPMDNNGLGLAGVAVGLFLAPHSGLLQFWRRVGGQNRIRLIASRAVS
jgi:hypothetical protein